MFHLLLDIVHNNTLSKKTFAIFYLTLPCMLFQSCAGMHDPQPNYQVITIEKQTKELENRVDEIYHRVSILQLNMDKHERALKTLEKEAGIEREESQIVISSPQPVVPENDTLQKKSFTPAPVQTESPESMYNNALTTYKKNDFQNAKRQFDAIVTNYPEHSLSINALYWSGECQYAEKRFSDAIITFKKVVEKYPNGNKVPDALLKTGYAYISIQDYENGRIYLRKVIKNYPFSPASTKAEKMLKNIKNK